METVDLLIRRSKNPAPQLCLCVGQEDQNISIESLIGNNYTTIGYSKQWLKQLSVKRVIFETQYFQLQKTFKSSKAFRYGICLVTGCIHIKMRKLTRRKNYVYFEVLRIK